MSGPLENPAATPRPANGVLRKLLATLEMIKFEHSVFAMPFALTGAMLAVHGWPPWRQVFWLIVAMVGARSAAMTFNRIADRKYDAANPRTRLRALPTGQLSLRFAVGFTAVSAALLVLAAYELNRLAFELSPAALAILMLYSYTKRFTRRFGIKGALAVSAALHVLTFALLVAVARIEHLGWIAAAGLAAVGGLLAWEHALVKPSDLSRLNAAFFTVNGYVSLLFFATWAADILLH